MRVIVFDVDLAQDVQADVEELSAAFDKSKSEIICDAVRDYYDKFREVIKCTL